MHLGDGSFAETVEQVYQEADRRGRVLIVRDWVLADFDFRGALPFPSAFSGLKELSGLRARPFALVRDGIDVWLSLGEVDLERFGPAYLAYVEALLALDLPLFRYEDLCASPDDVLDGIASLLDLPRSDAHKRFFAVTALNGDVDFLSRGNQLDEIKLLPRRRTTNRQIQAVESCTALMAANRLLGYPTNFDARPLESRLDRWRFGFARRLHNWRRQGVERG
ncbi:MAG: hypothetical protein AAF752_00540 [Bacteroidota bacterium]